MVKLRKNFNFNPDYGNLILDRNKGITEITYNHLNLPKKIVFENNDEMEYLYDAAGVKLRKKVKTGAITRTTHYIEGQFRIKKSCLFLGSLFDWYGFY